MKYRVYLTEEARKDLFDIHFYVAANDDPDKADALLGNLERTCHKLAYLPLKGHVPPELRRIGVEAYREIHWKPYRIVYEVVGSSVFVHAILDGRRDLQSLLEWRLLR